MQATLAPSEALLVSWVTFLGQNSPLSGVSMPVVGVSLVSGNSVQSTMSNEFGYEVPPPQMQSNFPSHPSNPLHMLRVPSTYITYILLPNLRDHAFKLPAMLFLSFSIRKMLGFYSLSMNCRLQHMAGCSPAPLSPSWFARRIFIHIRS